MTNLLRRWSPMDWSKGHNLYKHSNWGGYPIPSRTFKLVYLSPLKCNGTSMSMYRQKTIYNIFIKPYASRNDTKSFIYITQYNFFLITFMFNSNLWHANPALSGKKNWRRQCCVEEQLRHPFHKFSHSKQSNMHVPVLVLFVKINGEGLKGRGWGLSKCAKKL